jgi:regulatory protein
MPGRSVTEIPSTLLHKIEHFCAYQERCISDVDQKLRSWKVLPDKIPGILKRLQSEKFIDEDRFARLFVRGKFHINNWGRIKITYDLRRRNIHENIIRSALKEIGEEEYVAMIRELILKKKTEIPDRNNLIVREKIITFVTGKGFEFYLTEKILTELEKTNDYT